LFISQEHKLIFFHIPKTAGTSILSILNRSSMDNNLRIKNIIGQNLLKIVKEEQREVDKIYQSKTWPPMHINQTKIRKALELSEISTRNFFEFVIVRNPYDRILSLYNFSNYYTPNITSLDQLLDTCEENINVDSYFNFWFKSQMSWIENPLTDKVNIFKYEELDQFWNFIRARLNIELSQVPHANATKQKTVSELSKSQKDRIYNMFKDEFDALGYDR
jgi:hypothetical protein